MKQIETRDGVHLGWIILALLAAALLFCPLLWLLCPGTAHAQAVPPIYIAKVGKLSVDSANAGKFMWTNAKDSSLEVLAGDSGGVWVYNDDSSAYVHVWSGGVQQTGGSPYRYYFRDSYTDWYLEMIDGTGSNDSIRAKLGPAVDIVTVYPQAVGGGGGEVGSNGASTDNELVRFHGTTGDTIQATTSNAPTLSDAGLLTVPGGIVGKVDSTTDITTMDSISAQRIRARRVNTDSVGAFSSKTSPLTIWPNRVLPIDGDSGKTVVGDDTLPFKSANFAQLKLRFQEGGLPTWYTTDTTSTAVNTYVLSANTSTNTMYWAAPGAGGGEVNTASNLDGHGVGIWKDKSTYDLRFKRLFSTSNLLTIADATDSVNLTVNQGNMALSSIGGAVTDAQVPNTITIDNATNATTLNTVAAAEYLRRSGIVPLTGDWALGGYSLTGGKAFYMDSLRGSGTGTGVRAARIDSASVDTLWAGRADPDTLDLAGQKVTAFGNGTALSGSTLVVQANGDDIDVSSSGIKIATDGANSGQVLKYNGSAWEPADDATGAGGTGGDTSIAVYDSRGTPDDKAYWPSNGTFSFTDLTANAQNLIVGSTTDKVNIRADSGLTVGDTTAAGPFRVVVGSDDNSFNVHADSVQVVAPLRVDSGGVYLGANNFSGGTTSFANNDIAEAEINQGTLDSTELENAGVHYGDLMSMTSAQFLGRISDENGTGTILTTTGASSAISFASASITLAANEIVNADIDWPGTWEFPHGGQIIGQYGNTTDSIFRTGEIYNGTPPNDTVWTSMDSCWDNSGDMLGIIPIVIQPPGWATTLDSVYIWAQHSSATAAVVSLDSAVVYQQAADTSQMLTTRNTAITIADAGSTASVLTKAKPNVTVTGTAIPHTVKILLYYKADVSSSIRWRMKVRWDD